MCVSIPADPYARIADVSAQQFRSEPAICSSLVQPGLCAMAQATCEELWRTKLCRHGPDCGRAGCVFAHALSELCPPNEMDRCYTRVWRGGVDRWYGQNMTDDQLRIIQYYYEQTVDREIPQWVHGLIHYYSGQENASCGTMQWDYGLSNDQALLCRHRRGPLPFAVPEDLWTGFNRRRSPIPRRRAGPMHGKRKRSE